MFGEFYVEALLADEILIDQVWEAWEKGRLMIKRRGRIDLVGTLYTLTFRL